MLALTAWGGCTSYAAHLPPTPISSSPSLPPPAQVVAALQEYYSFFVSPARGGSITTDFSVPAEHCLPTLSYGEECLELASPYLGRCQVRLRRGDD